MPSEQISTDVLDARDRLPYWRDRVCATFVELECERVGSEDFFGSIQNRTIGDIQFSFIKASSQTVVRTRAKIAQSSRDYFLLSLQTHGHGVIEQDGRRAVLKPGDFALYDTTRPYDLRFNEQFGQLVLRLPREIVASRLVDAERRTALRIVGKSGSGRLASTFIRQLHREIDGIDPISAARLHASTVDLLATALAEQGGSAGVASEARLLLRRRITAFIDDHFADPRLTCAAIANAHGISDRHVRTIFEDAALGVSEMIWARRLDQAKRDLADPLLAHIGVTAIGYDVGFKDAAHFSRSFRAKFGTSPRDFREAAASARSAHNNN